MLAEQRHTAILNGLHQSGEVTVAALAKQLEVTDETIRRDLTKLAQRGRLVRTHGGAVLSDPERDASFVQRQSAFATEKRAIAMHAAETVNAGEVVAIDASTTCMELARLLAERDLDSDLTVVSNGLDVVRWLANRSGIRVICTGGEFEASGSCFVGPLAEDTLRRFAFTKAYVSCRGLDPARGASESTPAHAAIKREMLSLADETHLLVDSSKVGLKSACLFAGIEDFSSLITDGGLSDESAASLQGHDITIRVAELT